MQKNTAKITDNLIYKVFYPALTVAAVFLLWYIAAKSLNVKLILPEPSVAIGELFSILADGAIYGDLARTVLRSLLSFFSAFILAIALSYVSSKSRVFRSLMYPLVIVLRSLPTISIIFILYIGVKQNIRSVLIAFLVIFPTLYAAFLTAFETVDEKTTELTKVYKVKKSVVLVDFLLPSVAKSVYSETANGVSLTVKLVLAAEAITQTGMSLGNLMNSAKANFEMAELLAYTLIAVITAFLLEFLIIIIKKLVEKGWSKWI